MLLAKPDEIAGVGWKTLESWILLIRVQLPEMPFVLALIECEGADTLFLTRLLGLSSNKALLDWIRVKVKARYLRNSKLKPTDVYFVPAEAKEE